jgi:hypothetical protein
MPGKDFEFQAVIVDRAPWSNANPVRAIFREACALAGLPYFNPHSLRNTLVQLAYELKLDAERFKAWSQNLGHESCLTTFSSYGQIPPARQAEIIRGVASHGEGSNDRVEPALLRKLADEMERSRRLSLDGPDIRRAKAELEASDLETLRGGRDAVITASKSRVLKSGAGR